MKWFRLYTEVRRDPKLRRLPVSYRWVWIAILCIARESPKPGWLLLRKNMPAKPEDIADEANVPLEDAARAIEFFKSGSYEMLAEENGVLRVINWGKRQFENDSSAARTRRYRERLNRRKSPENAQPGHGDGLYDVTGDDACDGGSDVTCDVSKSSPHHADAPPQDECGEGLRDDLKDDRNDGILVRSEKAISHATFQEPSSDRRHCDRRCDVTGDVTSDSGSDVTGDATGDVTLQSNRGIVVNNIEVTDISVGILSASAPDGAERAHSLHDNPGLIPEELISEQEIDSAATLQSLESGERPAGHLARASPAAAMASLPDESIGPSQNAPFSRKLPYHDAIGRSSEQHPYSTSHPEPEVSKTGPTHPSPELPQQGELKDEVTEEPQDVSAEHPDIAAKPKVYLTKRRRRLSGWKLEFFDKFWESFAYKKGRAEAADAWLDIPELTPELAEKIIHAAGKEAKARPTLIANGQTPKWPQGWISGRRWEDWEDESAANHNQIGAPDREVKHDKEGSHSKEESQYRQSVGEAVRRFL